MLADETNAERADDAPDRAACAGPGRSATTPGGSADDAVSALTRMEHVLREIRGSLDAEAREKQHREFSWLRLTGSVFQVLTGGLTAWALLDCVFQAHAETVFIKLAFAGVLQLMALTAFLMTRDRDQ